MPHQTAVPSELEAPLAEVGVAVLPKYLTESELADIERHCERALRVSAFGGRRGGLRNPFTHSPELKSFGNEGPPAEIARSVLGASAFVARAILFDKTPDANWSVPWHQDVTIAVEQRIDTAGFGPWSIKEGVHHVQPPAGVLANMVTVRISLDACGLDNGPLIVRPGSHRNGVLDANSIEQWKQRSAVTCCTDAGGIVVMRPLLLHASSAAVHPTRRRVFHLEYVATKLPNGLQFVRA